MSADAIIPQIAMENLAGRGMADAVVHYATLGSLAGAFGRTMPAHRHERCFQIHLIETGHLTLLLDGVNYAVQAPVVFFTPPGVPHAFATNDEARGHVITIDRILAEELMNGDAALGRAWCAALQPSEARPLTRLFRMLRRESETFQLGTRDAVNAMTSLVLIAALRLAGASGTGSAPRQADQAIYRRLSDLVEKHFAGQWKVARFAEALAVTEVRLNDLCHRMAGKSPKQLILERAMLEARRLLAFSPISVGEIAEALGYEDASYFTRLFREREGVTPTEYRGKIRNG